MGDPKLFLSSLISLSHVHYEYMQLLYGCNTSFELGLLRGEQSQTFKWELNDELQELFSNQKGSIREVD